MAWYLFWVVFLDFRRSSLSVLFTPKYPPGKDMGLLRRRADGRSVSYTSNPRTGEKHTISPVGGTSYIQMIGMIVVFLGVEIGDLVFFRGC